MTYLRLCRCGDDTEPHMHPRALLPLPIAPEGPAMTIPRPCSGKTLRLDVDRYVRVCSCPGHWWAPVRASMRLVQPR